MKKGIELVFICGSSMNTEVYQNIIEGNRLDTTNNEVVKAVLESVKKALDIFTTQQNRSLGRYK